jgi:hypothetical protein
MSILSSMINMEELITEVLKSLDDNLASNDYMWYLSVRLINLSGIERFESHQTKEFVHVHRDLVHDGVDNRHHREHLSQVSLRVVVSIPNSDQGNKHAVQASLELIWRRIDNRIKVLKHHEKHRGYNKHDQQLNSNLFYLLIHI